MSQDTTQAKFRKAPKKDNEQPQIEENEVRIKGNMGNVKRYVDYACNLLKQENETKKELENEKKENENENENENKDDKKENETEKDDKKEKKIIKTFKTIVLKATGRAINKAVTTAEVVKRRVAGLHQDTKLETLEIVDVWEPTEEGLKEVKTTRRVASITIKLSIDPKEIEIMKKEAGYQPPISADAVKTSSGFPSRRSYRSNRRGRYNNSNNNGSRGNSRRVGGYRYNSNTNYYNNNRYSGRGGYNRRNNSNNYNRSYGNGGGRGYNRSYGGGGRGSYRGGFNRYNNNY